VGVQLAGHQADDLDWQRFFYDWRSKELSDAENDAAPVARGDERFPYAFGGGFVSQYWLARGRAGVAALFNRPPRTTREILLGPLPEAAAKRAGLRDRAEPALTDTFSDVDATSLGAWIARIYAARAGVARDARIGTAMSVAADVFSVQIDTAADQVVAGWRVAMRDDVAPSTWGGEAGASARGFDQSPGGDVYLVASDPPLSTPIGEFAWRALPNDATAASTANALVELPPLELPRSKIGCRVQLPPL